MKLFPFQRHAFAAAALTPGCILSFEQGLGKSFAAFAIPYLWRSPRVLLVVPGDLHEQLRETAASHFSLALPILRTSADLRTHRIHLPAAPLRKGQLPAFYLTSYEALTRNGADEWPEAPASRVRSRLIEARALAKELVLARLTGRKPDFKTLLGGVGEERHGITCVWKPSMARELKQLEARGAGFPCIVLDECTAIQGESKTSLGITLLDPERRLLLTGTPIKNRLASVFTLAWWAAGGSEEPTPRWPYPRDGRDTFSRQHLEVDRFLTREEDKAIRDKVRRSSVRLERQSARVCNVQRLWRLLSPLILRVRKADCGEPIMSKTVSPIHTAMGSAQAAVYAEHLAHRPIRSADGTHLSPLSAIGMQLTNLRIASLCPDSPALAEVQSNAHPGRKKSWSPWTPKMAAILSLVSDLLDNGEQVVIGSPFLRFNETLHAFLQEAKVGSLMLDGSTPPAERGELVRRFKSKTAPVLIASYEAMARGHSFENCSHLIAAGYPWSYDVFAQFVDRIWRINSPKPVTVYPVICGGSIEERMRDLFNDKSDTAQLSLDGKLTPETVEEIDPERLLAEAYDQFKASQHSLVEESTLEAGWPALRRKLGWSRERYREWHPPIVTPIVTAEDLANATLGTGEDPLFDFEIAKARLRAQFLKPPQSES